MKNKKIFSNNLENRIERIYAVENLWKLSFKTVLPSLLLTLLFGIYIFIDQMLIVNLVPQDGHDYLKNYFIKINQIDLYNKVAVYISENTSTDVYLSVSNSNNDFITYATSSLIGPFTLIILSFGYLISAGSAVIFSRALALKNDSLKEKVIWNSFYSSLIFGIVATVIMLLIQDSILKTLVPSSSSIVSVDGTNSQGLTVSDLRNYFNCYYQGTVKQADRYLYWINGAIIFMCVSNLLVFCMRAEGKNLWITLIGVTANFINIIFDVIFLYVLKIGIMGGGIATFIGQAFNAISPISYLIFLNYWYSNGTTIALSILKKRKLISWKIIVTSILLGSSTFLRDLVLAIANIVYIPVFYNTIGFIDSASLASFSKVIASPIYNLFFFSIFGIIDGMRPIISYNFSLKNYQRVKWSYWIGLSISLFYSFLVISLVFSIVPYNNTLLSFLNAKTDFDRKNIFLLFLSMMWQFPFLSLSVSGLALFQSANKKFINILLSLMQGAITYYIVLYIMSPIAKSTMNTSVMVFTGFTNIVLSSLIIFITSVLFIRKICKTGKATYEGKFKKIYDKIISKYTNWLEI